MVEKTRNQIRTRKKDIRNIGTTVEERREKKREILSETCFWVLVEYGIGSPQI